MLRYLGRAFVARPRIPGFGALPLNLMGVAAFALLGFANPAFWLLGAGLEASYLALTATNPRFRNVVDGAALSPARREAPKLRQSSSSDLLRDLTAPARSRLTQLGSRLEKILDLYQKFQVDDFLAANNRESLATLLGHYGRLLVAQESIERHWTGDADELGAEVVGLEQELAAAGLSGDLRASKMKTLEILQMRLANQKRKETVLAEIGSELKRIEAQFDLALENAAMSSQPSSISADLAVDLTRFDAQALAAAVASEKPQVSDRRRIAKREGQLDG